MTLDQTLIFALLAVILGMLVWGLVLYFSRPVVYAGEYPIGPSRQERILAPFIFVFGAVLLVYVVYTLFTGP